MVSERNIHRHVVLNVSVHFLQKLPTCLDKKKSYHYNIAPIF